MNVPPASEPATVRLDAHAVADLATAVWRLRGKVGEDDPAYRHLRSTLDALTDAGVEAQSHDGAAYDPGLRLSVVAFQPTPGLGRELIIETIRPSVYVRGQLLRMGAVIVGTPPLAPDDQGNQQPEKPVTEGDSDS
ncbi:hypothetical protein [Microlunatus speluncae]|uniref:hypothetical protein n=1 Tax=Microlunatus speluncae TaxID=2594267 RepID=UPI00126608D0|nr:hypothetical protein [Microlunatus speluncae]